jgi:hypothetical protein
MPKYSPEFIDFGFTEYNLKEINLNTAMQDGIYAGKMLMRDEIKKLVNTIHPKPTKATEKLLAEIDKIRIEPYANDSSR